MPRLLRAAPLALLVAFGWACASPPPPTASGATSVEAVRTGLAVDPALAEALMADVRVLAADSLEGREAGTPGGARGRAYLLGRLAEIGVSPQSSSGFEQAFPLRNGGTGVNLVARVEGTEHPDRVIVVGAHYDHVGVEGGEIFNGADDNASGTAALLALAERLVAQPPQHTTLLVWFDAEERGLQGARAFVENPPVPLGSVLAMLNMDMVSRHDGVVLWAVGTAHYPHLRPLLEPVAARAPVPLRFGRDTGEGRDNWTTASDHGPFHRAGVPFIYFGVDDHADYHRPTDTADRIQPDFFAGAVTTILDAFRALDGQGGALAAGR